MVIFDFWNSAKIKEETITRVWTLKLSRNGRNLTQYTTGARVQCSTQYECGGSEWKSFDDKRSLSRATRCYDVLVPESVTRSLLDRQPLSLALRTRLWILQVHVERDLRRRRVLLASSVEKALVSGSLICYRSKHRAVYIVRVTVVRQTAVTATVAEPPTPSVCSLLQTMNSSTWTFFTLRISFYSSPQFR